MAAPQTTAFTSLLYRLPALLIAPFRLVSPPVSWLLAPLLVLLLFAARALSLIFLSPLNLLSRLENLYIYCGVAALIGALVGSLVAMLSHTLTTILGLQASPLEIASRRLKSSSRARQRRVDPIDDSDSNRQLSTADENSPSSSSPLTLRPGFPTAVPTILEEEDEDSQADYTRRKRRMQQQIRKSSSLREEMPMNGNDTSEESSF